jgi:hypothetical protein
MRRLQNVVNQPLSPSEVVEVDTNVPRGCAPVSYKIEGFDTVYNPIVKRANGHRQRQTSLPITFASGVNDVQDGVSVEAVLSVCSSHLDSKQLTPDANPLVAKANAHLRKALELLAQQHHQRPSLAHAR